MTHWSDPKTVALQYSAFNSLQHAIAGIIFWEFVLHLDFDWRLIHRQAKFSWTPWIYIVCRLSSVAGLATIIAGNDIKHEINCTVWLVFSYFFPFLALWLSSALIGIRVIAIWNRSLGAIIFVVLTMLGFAGTFLHGLIAPRGQWDPTELACLIFESADNLPNAVGCLIADFSFLLVMLVGLLRHHEARVFGLWQLLWKQGVVWIFLATVAEVPSVVFLTLNLNVPMNMMFLPTEAAIMLIGSTRMYRSLTNFFEPQIGTTHSSGPNIVYPRMMRPTNQDTENSGITIVPLEVSVHRVQEEHSESVSQSVLHQKVTESRDSNDNDSQEFVTREEYKTGGI